MVAGGRKSIPLSRPSLRLGPGSPSLFLLSFSPDSLAHGFSHLLPLSDSPSPDSCPAVCSSFVWTTLLRRAARFCCTSWDTHALFFTKGHEFYLLCILSLPTFPYCFLVHTYLSALPWNIVVTSSWSGCSDFWCFP